MSRITRLFLIRFFLFCTIGMPIIAQAFVVERISVQGNQRVKEKTILSFLPVQVGTDLSTENRQLAIQSLFKSGLFEDIELYESKGELIVAVRERPTISNITIKGNYLIKTDDIKKSMKEFGLEKRRIFKRNALETIDLELQKAYHSQGKYGVKINTELSMLENNMVDIKLNIQEGFPAKVVKVNIVGNHAFSDETLEDLLKTGIPSWWAIFSSRDKYSKPKLQNDLAILRNFYLDRGYLNFDIKSTQVSVSEDKRSLYININVAEGDKFFIRKVNLAGRRLVAEEDLRVLMLPVKSGDVFSRKKLQTVSSLLKKRLGKDGYARADVEVIPQVVEGVTEVDVTFNIVLGNKYSVRKISFSGHSGTHDVVLRRELRQLEGAWFDSTKVERGRARLERLDFIQGVKYEINDVPGSNDQVDIKYSVDERLTGSLKAGVGYNGSSVFYNFGLSRTNILGTGNDINVNFERSDYTKSASLTYTNPYVTHWGLSRTASVYYRETDVSDSNLSNYILNTLGAGLNYGIPVTENARFNIGFNVNKYELFDTQGSPQEVRDFLYGDEACTSQCKPGKGEEYMTYVPSLGFVYDTRNKSIFATKGMKQSVSIEQTLSNSDLDYFKVNLSSRFYVPAGKSTFIIRNNLGYGEYTGDDKNDLPPFEKYFAGGIRTVRGYRAGTLKSDSGTIDSYGNAYGGNFRWYGGLDYVFPPTKETSNIRFSAFYDFGNVYSSTSEFEKSEFRTSAGLAMNWITPVGPLIFSYAEPLNNKQGDRLNRFQFSFGAAF